jgi:hypothetical protein
MGRFELRISDCEFRIEFNPFVMFGFQIRNSKSAIRNPILVEAPGIEPGSKSQRRRTLHA